MEEAIRIITSLGPSGLLAVACWTLWVQNKELRAENKTLHDTHVNEIKGLYAQQIKVMEDWRKALEDDHG